MGFVQPSTIQQLAESLAIPKLSSDAAKALAPHIDVRLREVVQEACKFSRHAKRSTLTAEDVNNALRLRNCQNRVQPLYGFGGKDPARFVRAAGHADLCYVQDVETPTQAVIERPLPKLPVEVGVVPHWLAIDGVQPNIPENIPLERPKLKRPRIEHGSQKAAKRRIDSGAPTLQPAAAAPVHATSGDGSEPPAPVIPPVRLVISLELLRVFENLREVVAEARALPDDAPGGPFCGWPVTGPDGRPKGLPPEVEKHQQREQHALQCLTYDPGQHPLAPATIELICEQVRTGMKQLPQLHLLIKVARSMLRNREIEIERYLDRLLSPLMTCILTRRLGAAPWEDHWAVRAAAADAIAEICALFGGRHPNLTSRIVKQYVGALTDRNKALPCHYGAIVGLTRLGHRTVQLMLLPFAQPYLRRLDKALAPRNPNEVQRMEAVQVAGALTHACASCAYASMTSRLSRDFFGQLRPLRLPPAAARLDFRAAPATAKRKCMGSGARGVDGASASRTNGATAAALPRVPKQQLPNGTGQGPAELSGKGGGSISDGRPRPADPDGNDLADAWRDDAALGQNLAAAHELFGPAMQPYVPEMPISQVIV